jgi:hypothetical protein
LDGTPELTNKRHPCGFEDEVQLNFCNGLSAVFKEELELEQDGETKRKDRVA